MDRKQRFGSEAHEQVDEFVGDSCEKTDKTGWCYLTGKAAGRDCSQAIKFSSLGNPVGALVSLQCIKSNETAAEAGAPATP